MAELQLGETELALNFACGRVEERLCASIGIGRDFQLRSLAVWEALSCDFGKQVQAVGFDLGVGCY